MSIAVWYSTSKAVVSEVGERLIAEAKTAAPLIWYEPIQLFVEDDYPTILKGWSKCPPTSVELDDGAVVQLAESEWSFMDYWDSRQFFKELSTWSKRYKVDWILTVEGKKIGKIQQGRLSWGLRRHLAASARRGKAGPNEESNAARANELRQKYPLS